MGVWSAPTVTADMPSSFTICFISEIINFLIPLTPVGAANMAIVFSLHGDLCQRLTSPKIRALFPAWFCVSCFAGLEFTSTLGAN